MKSGEVEMCAHNRRLDRLTRSAIRTSRALVAINRFIFFDWWVESQGTQSLRDVDERNIDVW